MAKFFGEIGYATSSVESAPGVWTEGITEVSYYGDVVRNSRRVQDTTTINDDITVQNSISIVADAFANENFMAIRYVKWMGSLWTVTEVELQAPRLLLRLGGVYNGPQAS
jgi:hypothetical protein